MREMNFTNFGGQLNIAADNATMRPIMNVNKKTWKYGNAGMNVAEFQKKAIKLVGDWYKAHEIKEERNLFVVWCCRILDNNKCLIGSAEDTNYFEITYNGQQREFYVDAYNKIDNSCVKAEEIK